MEHLSNKNNGYFYHEIMNGIDVYREIYNKQKSLYMSSDKHDEHKKIYYNHRSIYEEKMKELITGDKNIPLKEFDDFLYDLVKMPTYDLIIYLLKLHSVKEKNYAIPLKNFLETYHNKLENSLNLVDTYNKCMKILRKEYNITDKEIDDRKKELDKKIKNIKIKEIKVKLIDKDCEPCIYNRVFQYIDVIYNRINENKDYIDKIEFLS